MRRRSATNGLIVDASRMLYETVGVLSETERGTATHASGIAARRVALWRRREASPRLEFVILPPGLVSKTKSSIIYGGQG